MSTETTAWTTNEHGFWCDACGNLVAGPDAAEPLPESCRQCGFPEIDKVAAYFCDDGEDAECPNCGGEGIVYCCFEEFACIDPEGGCDECARRCDWCQGRPKP